MAEREQEQRSRAAAASSFGLMARIAGYAFGALSLLELLKYLSPLEIYGDLKIWVDAYSAFVDRANALLFGWMAFLGFRISNAEANLVILALVFASALTRARRKAAEAAGDGFSYFVSVLALLLGPMLLALLLFSIPWSVAVAGAWLAFWGGAFLTSAGEGAEPAASDAYTPAPDSGAARREIYGVLAVLAALVMANYLYFVPK